MKTRLMLLVTGLLAVAAAGPGAQSREPQGKPAAAQAQPVSDAIRASWEGAKKNIRETADVVPESLYSFSPVPGTVRTIGELIGHVAGANYLFCASAKGEKAPSAEDAYEKLGTKAAIVKAWVASVAYCDAAFKALTDRSAAEIVDQPFGAGKGPRAAALLGNIGHLNEHYGNLVTYMRIKGIVPPSSRR